MNNSKSSQVDESIDKLKDNLRYSNLLNCIISIKQIIKEVFPLNEIENHVEMSGSFENFNHFDDIRMLTYFKNINFSQPLMDLQNFHVCLANCLDCYLLTSPQICASSYLPKLTLA